MTESTACRFPHNAPRTGYNRGCRCTRCVHHTNAQRRAEHLRNAETYRQYRRTHKRTTTRTPAPPKMYTPRPGCVHPHLSPYTAWDKGCRCTHCTSVQRQRRNAIQKQVLPRAKDAMRNRARTGKTVLPSTPEQRNELLKVYIRAQILQAHGIPCHVDHIVPLEHGGTHTADNVRLLDPGTNVARRYTPDLPCVPLELTTPEQLREYTETLKKLG